MKNEADTLNETARLVERVKRSCVSLIIKTGKLLKIDHTAVITALSFLHRFYGEYSVFKNDRFLVSMACVYLGGKVADCPKSSRDVLVSGFSVLNPNKKPEKAWLEEARKKAGQGRADAVVPDGIQVFHEDGERAHDAHPAQGC